MHDTARDAQEFPQEPNAPGAPLETGEITESGQELIQRAPTGYLWNQAYSFWLFITLLLYDILVARSLSSADTKVFIIINTAANWSFYLASLGLSSAASVYLPRALAEGGISRVRALAIRLVLIRMVTVLAVGAVVMWGTPVLVSAVRATGWAFGIMLVNSAVQPISAHGAVIAAYVVGVGMSNLLGGMLTALIRTRAVFIWGSIGQALLLAIAFGLGVTFGGGIDGLMAAQALPAAFTALVYAIILRHVLQAKSDPQGNRLFWPTMRLGIASWLVDLPNNSIKQVAVGQLTVFGQQELNFFNYSYQMGDAGTRFFTDGLGGISTAAMSAAYADGRREPLAVAWRTVSKLQLLLAVPLAAFCVPHASAIMAIFGSGYASAGSLFAIFLIINALMQITGGATQQWVLYVLGWQRWVVASSWGAFGMLLVLGYWLIPAYQALGALLAVGLARLAAAIFLFVIARIAVHREYPWAFTLKILAGMIPAVAFAVAWRPESFALLVAAGAVYAVIFLACMWLIRPLDGEDAGLLTQVATPMRVFFSLFVARKTGSRGGAIPIITSGERPAVVTAPSGPMPAYQAETTPPPDR